MKIHNRDQLKVLLLQIRDAAKVRQEEHHSFARYSCLGLDQIDILNVFDTPSFSPSIVDEYDALFVGGASEASVLEPEKHTFIDPSKALLLHCVETDKPVFASCYGFQLAVIALGGTIIRDETNFEMGTVPISLTENAATDPVFEDIHDGFMAISVHCEKATEPPPNCETLAFTDMCCHSFKVIDKPFWTFQFHPEVDRATLVERLTIYKAHYTRDDEHLAEVLQHTCETPESNQLVRNFVDNVLLKES